MKVNLNSIDLEEFESKLDDDVYYRKMKAGDSTIKKREKRQRKSSYIGENKKARK